MALADAELLDYPVALNLTRSLAFETDYVPWTAVVGQLIEMEKLLLETIVNQPFSVKYPCVNLKTMLKDLIPL